MSSERDEDGRERIELPEVADTWALAARVAAELSPGSVVALEGELGAGKTEFTRGLARALGVPAEQTVRSPSFVLLNVYTGGALPLAHFDAYFLEGEDDFEQAGFLDQRSQGAVVVVEWADRVRGALPDDAVRIELEHTREGRRAWLGAARPENPA